MSGPLPPSLSGGQPSEPERVQALRKRDQAERTGLLRAHRREALIFLVLAVVFVALFGRTAYWQLAQGDTLASRAAAGQMRAIAVPAGRGSISDASGRVLAISVTHDSVVADPDVIRSVQAMDADAATLAELLALPVAGIRAQLDVPGAYVRLRDANGATLLLTAQQTAAVSDAIGRGALPGMALIPVVQRIYPAGGLAAQVLGFVSVGKKAGQYGVEEAYERILAGQPGMLYTAVDAAGNPLATGVQRQTPAVLGASVTLTLDATVQYWAEQGLARAAAETGASGGSVIVMDPRTGALIAMASLPSFDPNAYGQYPIADFNNPAISAMYDPGSVMKGVTMAVGLDTGTITPYTVFDDPGVFWAAGTPIHNWDHQAHGSVTMMQVLQESLNTGAAWVATQIGSATFDKYLGSFGFGSHTGVDLPGEARGQMASPKDPPALALAENAFGEGIAVTPLQMVAAYGALANGGVLMRPYVVASVAADGGLGQVTTHGPQRVRQVVSADAARTVTQMLVASAYSETQMYLLQGYSVAAKTGTSVLDQSHPQITYASVIGYAPASHPRFVLLVKLDHPRKTIYGATAAAPLWRALAQQLLDYYRIPPDSAGPAGSQG
jgi:cell division protein FtsI/penicillin-binding protein 2